MICQMQGSLISNIKDAIKSCTSTLEKMELERIVVMKALRKARYINCDTLHIVEHQYDEKINNIREEISSMTEHLSELENQNGKDDN